MADNATPTGKPERDTITIDESLPLLAVYDPWWTDLRCIALCQLIARTIMRSSPPAALPETIEMADE